MALDLHGLTAAQRPKLYLNGEGMFGRLFPELLPLDVPVEEALALGAERGPMDVSFEGPGIACEDNPRIPAGWAFFGQFIAHDITNDRQPLQSHEEVGRNFRSPRLDLECVYGAGVTGQPYLYDKDDYALFLIGTDDRGTPGDLPRNPQGLALIGDARNDTYFFISQLHLAFLKLHNRLLLEQRAAGAANPFEATQQLLRWHYQWIVLHEFLPLTVGQALVQDIIEHGPRWYQAASSPFIPVEFSDGAYRFGHAQLRDLYQINDALHDVRLFPDTVGLRPVPSAYQPDWARFFDFGGAVRPQLTRYIDASYGHCMIRLPETLTGQVARPEYRSLAGRDLQRALATDLPSGEAVARAYGEVPLTPEQIGLSELGWRYETPLPIYVLREAAVQHDGQQLGAVGGRIVAEVLLGLMQADPTAYLNAQPDWQPSLPTIHGSFSIADLLRAADVA
ncbi:MAG: peroxidase [Roseiflexaceae bacterium]|nr:peroxidase [Roseiflexaceae bacterium]